jgi:predicted negative regulator of RcsB-dependent stress response
MKSLSLIALGGLCLSASAMAAQPQTILTVHAPDPLAVAAIQQGDLARAEAILAGGRLDAGDPVRLINLGDVYWLSGRQSEAVAAWRRALASRDQYDVQTAGGRLLSTYDIAREALAAHGRPLQSASN